MNQRAVAQYLKDGGHASNVQVDAFGQPAFDLSNFHQRCLQIFSTNEIFEPPKGAFCILEVFILYLYGTHNQTVTHLEQLSPIKSLTNTKFIYGKKHIVLYIRLLHALDFWEERHNECNVLARLILIMTIFRQQVLNKLNLVYHDKLIDRLLVSNRFGIVKPTPEQLLHIYNRYELLEHFAISIDEHSIPVLRRLISINLIQPKYDLTPWVKQFIMSKIKTKKRPFQLIEFLCAEYPQEFGSDPLTTLEITNMVRNRGYIQGILSHVGKYKDLLTRCSNTYQISNFGKIIFAQFKNKLFLPQEYKVPPAADLIPSDGRVSDSIELITEQIKTRFHIPKDYVVSGVPINSFLSKENLEKVCLELLSSMCYNFNFNLSEIPPTFHEEAIQFKQTILDTATALYQTTDIIIPLILVIIENIFHTYYLHAHPVERTCLKQLVFSIIIIDQESKLIK